MVSISLLTSTVFAQPERPDGKVNDSLTVGFEGLAPGRFKSITTRLGVWETDPGEAIIDNRHAKSGKQCIQLAGGTSSSVILKLDDEVSSDAVLSFWAERWTARKPFTFRVYKNDGDSWKEIYNGDQQIKVGRAFLSHVKIPLSDSKLKLPKLTELKFTVTSPPNTGILIDDVRIAPPKPQKIVAVELVPTTLPALIGADHCHLAKLIVEVDGNQSPLHMRSISGRIQGLSSFQTLHLKKHTAQTELQVLKLPTDEDNSSTWQLKPLKLSEGRNIFWIVGRLRVDANIDEKVGATIRLVEFSNGQSLMPTGKSPRQRMGIALRQRGQDGVHTYRIPGLATTNKGTLIGVYDVRYRTGGDLPGDIDVGMSRSTDGGRTWEPMKIIMDMGNDPKWNFDGVGDPAILIDQTKGTIWVAATWSHGNRSWRGSGPGLTPKETGQLMLVRSDDDGVTWSKPINITQQIKRPEWCFILQGPGKGITMRDGTLVFPAQYQDPPNSQSPAKHRLPHSTIIYSKDHGKTWKVGTGAFDDTTESQVVEISPGTLMLNCRYNRKSARVVMTTNDLGKTWKKHPTSERSLIEPRACMASLIDVDQELKKSLGSWLLFSNPDSLQGRKRILIKASHDKGLTWPKQFRLLLDEETSAGYSCLSMIDEETVGILYEGSQAQMTFQRIPLKELIEDKTRKPPRGQKRQAPNTQGSKSSTQRQSLKLPQVFGNHMVLQAGQKIPVWGQASPNATVHVTLGTEKRLTTANKAGHWLVRLDPRNASNHPLTLTTSSRNEEVVFKNVLIGEVWLCAGQSNMEWKLQQSTHGPQELGQLDAPEHSASPIRLLNLVPGARGTSTQYGAAQLERLNPQSFCRGQWEESNAESTADFSAVAWFFGRSLQKELKVPIGLICPAVGGTPTEAWISEGALADHPQLKKLVSGNWLDNAHLGEFCRQRGEENLVNAIQIGLSLPGDKMGPNHPFKPGFMWEAGIKPLIPYAIRGVIWYQGESNAETELRVRQHEQLLPLLIQQWRDHWKLKKLPFLFVQLPAMNRPHWPLFRESQRRLLYALPNVGMAVTIDTGIANDVHPPLKKPVGERLARWACGTVYARKSYATYTGPLSSQITKRGLAILISFSQVGSGLKSSDGQPLRHFEVCGEDRVYFPATAEILNADSLVVFSDKVTEPMHVRYLWKPVPLSKPNFVNNSGLPASPFSSE